MTSDGSEVYFTTADKLSSDNDTSADIYRADVGSSSATLTRVSTGTGAGDTDLCNPSANLGGPHWNTVGASANCGAVAFSGGSAVAADDGTIFFLSPEKLDGSGTQDEPNLYVKRPGSAPHFVGTLDPDDDDGAHAVRDNEVQGFENFQVDPERRLRRLRDDRLADRLPERRPFRDLSL